MINFRTKTGIPDEEEIIDLLLINVEKILIWFALELHHQQTVNIKDSYCSWKSIAALKNQEYTMAIVGLQHLLFIVMYI